VRRTGAQVTRAIAGKEALTGNPGQRHRQSASLTNGRGGMDVGIWEFKMFRCVK
jgi:hypothetical protein